MCAGGMANFTGMHLPLVVWRRGGGTDREKEVLVTLCVCVKVCVVCVCVRVHVYMHLCESEREIGCMCAGALFAGGLVAGGLFACAWVDWLHVHVRGRDGLFYRYGFSPSYLN